MSDRAAHVGIQVTKETGNLKVTVKDPQGNAIKDAGVEVWHLRGSNLAGDPRFIGTNDQGVVEFKKLPGLIEDGKKIPWYVKVKKDGCGPEGANPWRSGEVQKNVDFSQAGKADVVLVPRKPPEPGTKVERVKVVTFAAPGLVPMEARPSTGGPCSGDYAPTKDNVLVVVCGTPTLTFHPEGNKSYLPVDWKITPIHPVTGATRGGPRPIAQPFDLKDGRQGCWLATDTPGMFRLSAHLDDSQAAMLIFFVRVTIKDPLPEPRCSKKVTTATESGMVQLKLGDFEEYTTAAFSIKPTMVLDPGFSDDELDSMKTTDIRDLPYSVKTVGINMCTSSSCQGTYANGSVQEVWRPGVATPVLDTNPTASSARGPSVSDPRKGPRQCLIYMHRQTDVSGRSATQKEFWFSTYDSPVIEFPGYHRNKSALTALQGTIEFVMWVAAYSESIPDMPLVLARCPWTLTASCSGISVQGDPEKDKVTGAKFGTPSGQVTHAGFTKLAGATPAHDLGVPTRPPVYVGGNAWQYLWTPPS
jgi:hypothetical protein